jgi:hypothetical protein
MSARRNWSNLAYPNSAFRARFAHEIDGSGMQKGWPESNPGNSLTLDGKGDPPKWLGSVLACMFGWLRTVSPGEELRGGPCFHPGIHRSNGGQTRYERVGNLHERRRRLEGSPHRILGRRPRSLQRWDSRQLDAQRETHKSRCRPHVPEPSGEPLQRGSELGCGQAALQGKRSHIDRFHRHDHDDRHRFCSRLSMALPSRCFRSAKAKRVMASSR